MKDKKASIGFNKVDPKEFEIPETVFVRDIENRVFQGIVLQCLSGITGLSLIEGNFIDNILGSEGVKGIVAEQDSKTHSVNIRVEVNIEYGISIPEKAEEIQTKITEEITKLTGLHVASVHIVFKNIIPKQNVEQSLKANASLRSPAQLASSVPEEYSDEF